MKRLMRVEADGVDLTITFEGVAPPGLLRVMAREIRTTAFDFISNVKVKDEVYGATVGEVTK